jgi:hypothetical protein
MTDDETIDLVHRDVVLGLSHAFDERDAGWHPVADLIDDGLPTNGRTSVVPWEFDCTHANAFLGIPSTGRDITIRGTTIVVDRGGDGADGLRYHRYIDWAQVMTDLGVQATFRPVLPLKS